MWSAVVSIFPDMFRALTGDGVVARAIAAGRMSLRVIDPRDFATDRRRSVDDHSYGGGPGMVMTVGPLSDAVRRARASAPGPVTTVYMSPQGKRFDQAMAAELAGLDNLLFVAGRYEGVDERFVEREVDLEVSLGDFVMTGGELAVMVVLDAVARLLPGTLGNPASTECESFADNLLDYPHYSRPAEYRGACIPSVLLSGDHAAIARWRRGEALARTWQRRPDLLVNRVLCAEDRALLRQHLAGQDLAQAQAQAQVKEAE